MAVRSRWRVEPSITSKFCKWTIIHHISPSTYKEEEETRSISLSRSRIIQDQANSIQWRGIIQVQSGSSLFSQPRVMNTSFAQESHPMSTRRSTLSHMSPIRTKPTNWLISIKTRKRSTQRESKVKLTNPHTSESAIQKGQLNANILL